MPFQNEILHIASLVVFFGGLVAFFRFFGKQGIYAWTVICTIAANIEVLILVHAFGLDTTLGNVIFASSFLATDIMSEIFGKKEANRCVRIGILANVTFILISQSWFLYIPAGGDTMAGPIRTVFANTPRVMLASLFAYAVCETFDVWAYHAWWNWSARKFGDRRRLLWLRNNGSTLISQFVNAVLFNVAAFAGVYSVPVLISICLSTYLIYVICALLDTPIVYLARKMKDSGKIKD